MVNEVYVDLLELVAHAKDILHRLHLGQLEMGGKPHPLERVDVHRARDGLVARMDDGIRQSFIDSQAIGRERGLQFDAPHAHHLGCVIGRIAAQVPDEAVLLPFVSVQGDSRTRKSFDVTSRRPPSPTDRTPRTGCGAPSWACQRGRTGSRAGPPPILMTWLSSADRERAAARDRSCRGHTFGDESL